jgi:hypothetical protein
MNNQYELLAGAIVKYQESIVGQLAWKLAGQAKGVMVAGDKVTVKEGKESLENLVQQYEGLFGRASVEVCKDAIRPLLPKMKVDLPGVLL